MVERTQIVDMQKTEQEKDSTPLSYHVENSRLLSWVYDSLNPKRLHAFRHMDRDHRATPRLQAPSSKLLVFF